MFSHGVSDLAQGIRDWRVWTHLALSDVSLKYRRTLIGPLWITASMGVMVLSMGVLFSRVFGQKLDSFFPYLTAGIIGWNYVANTLTEGCTALLADNEMYKSVPAPFSYSIFRTLVRSLIAFVHNLLIFIIVALIFRIDFISGAPMFLLGLAMVSLNLTWMMLLLAIGTARFRDMQLMVSAVISILFMVTPVFWQKQAVGDQTWLFVWNPFTYLVDAIRDPLIGNQAGFEAVIILSVMAGAGWLVALMVFDHTRDRIVFWL